MKVVSKTPDWQGFLRRAKNSHPKEHIEAIWGLETVDSFRITAFKRIKIDKKNSKGIYYDDIEVARQKWLAEKEGYKFLGTVHTHPHKDHTGAPTDDDHEDGIKQGERLMGVLHLWKESNGRFKWNLKWWFPQQPLEFQLLDE